MLAKQYIHRLPADYDMGRIRERAASLAPLWDATPGLGFKGFAMRTRGRLGASGNEYSSIYLWLDAAAAAEFIFDDRFGRVVSGFGRPRIETWLPFDARKGRATGAEARALYREDLPLGVETDLPALRGAEAERNAALAAQPGTLAAVSAIDPTDWRLLRLLVSAEAAEASHQGIAYDLLHLARPGLARLG